jgi:hypothetical protein
MSHKTIEETVFTLLSNRRRRQVVRALQELEPPVSLGELAEHVAAVENEKNVSAVTSDERRQVYTALQQRHLDKLADAEIIEYDRDAIVPTDRMAELEVQLEVVDEDNIPWAEYYLGLSVVCGVAVLTAAAGIYPAVVPHLGWAVGVVVAFGLSAAVHVYSQTTTAITVTDLFNTDQ